MRADQQLLGISELPALFQLPVVGHSLLLAFLTAVISVCAAAQASTSNAGPMLPDVADFDYANRAVQGPTARKSAALASENSQITPFRAEPLSVVIVLDATASMATRIDEARKALGELIRTSNAHEMALVVIHDRPQIAVHLGGSSGEIERAAETVQVDGFGAIWDGMYLGIQELENSRCRRKALVVISDDRDRYGRHSPSELMSLLKETRVEVYVMGMFDRYANRFQVRMRALQLDEIISATGGRVLAVNGLSPAAAQIACELRHPIHQCAPNGQ